jgi:hypothetical protein
VMGAEGSGTEAMKVATAEMVGTGEARAVVRAVAWAAGTAAAGTAAVRVAAMGAAAMVREVVDSAAAAVDETVVLVARAAVVRGAVVTGAVARGAVARGAVDVVVDLVAEARGQQGPQSAPRGHTATSRESGAQAVG